MADRGHGHLKHNGDALMRETWRFSRSLTVAHPTWFPQEVPSELHLMAHGMPRLAMSAFSCQFEKEAFRGSLTAAAGGGVGEIIFLFLWLVI